MRWLPYVINVVLATLFVICSFFERSDLYETVQDEKVEVSKEFYEACVKDP